MPQEGDIRLFQGQWQEFRQGQWVPLAGEMLGIMREAAAEDPELRSFAEAGNFLWITPDGYIAVVVQPTGDGSGRGSRGGGFQGDTSLEELREHAEAAGPIIPDMPPTWTPGNPWPPRKKGEPAIEKGTGDTIEKPGPIDRNAIETAIAKAEKAGWVLDKDSSSVGYLGWTKVDVPVAPSAQAIAQREAEERRRQQKAQTSSKPIPVGPGGAGEPGETIPTWFQRIGAFAPMGDPSGALLPAEPPTWLGPWPPKTWAAVRAGVKAASTAGWLYDEATDTWTAEEEDPAKGWTLQEWNALSPSEQQAIEARVAAAGLKLFFDETSQEIRRQDIEKPPKTLEELKKEAASQGLVVVWDKATQEWVKDNPDTHPLNPLIDRAFDRGQIDKVVAFNDFSKIDINKRPQEAQRLFDEAMRWVQDPSDYDALISYWQGATGAPAPPSTPEQQRALNRIGLTASTPPQFDARDIQQGLGPEFQETTGIGQTGEQPPFPPYIEDPRTGELTPRPPSGFPSGGGVSQSLVGDLPPFVKLIPRAGLEDTEALEVLQSLGLDPLFSSYIASQIAALREKHATALNERAMQEAEAARRRTFASAQEAFPEFVGSETRAGFIPFRRDPLPFDQAQALSVEAARGSFNRAQFPFQKFLGGEMERLQREFDVTPQAIAQREAEERRRQQKALASSNTTFFSPLG